jgi:hypothetical protein
MHGADACKPITACKYNSIITMCKLGRLLRAHAYAHLHGGLEGRLEGKKEFRREACVGCPNLSVMNARGGGCMTGAAVPFRTCLHTSATSNECAVRASGIKESLLAWLARVTTGDTAAQQSRLKSRNCEANQGVVILLFYLQKRSVRMRSKHWRAASLERRRWSDLRAAAPVLFAHAVVTVTKTSTIITTSTNHSAGRN